MTNMLNNAISHIADKFADQCEKLYIESLKAQIMLSLLKGKVPGFKGLCTCKVHGDNRLFAIVEFPLLSGNIEPLYLVHLNSSCRYVNSFVHSKRASAASVLDACLEHASCNEATAVYMSDKMRRMAPSLGNYVPLVKAGQTFEELMIELDLKGKAD